jgi:hypothetical protein
LYRCALGQKPGVGATDHTKRVSRRSNPKIDDYTQNSSENQSKSKNQPQNSTSAQDFEALTIGSTQRLLFIFLICPVPDQRVKNAFSKLINILCIHYF